MPASRVIGPFCAFYGTPTSWFHMKETGCREMIWNNPSRMRLSTSSYAVLHCSFCGVFSLGLGGNFLRLVRSWRTHMYKQPQGKSWWSSSPCTWGCLLTLWLEAQSTPPEAGRALTSVSSVNAAGGDNNGFLRAINTVTGVIDDRLWQHSLLSGFFPLMTAWLSIMVSPAKSCISLCGQD